MFRVPNATTTAQRKNISVLLGYLISIQNTPQAHDYNHDDLYTCTFGYAVRSQLFPVLNENVIPTTNIPGHYGVNSVNDQYDELDDIIDDVFGDDYCAKIVYGSDIYDYSTGKPQLDAVIARIKKLYKIKPTTIVTVVNTEQVDMTKVKIEARITVLEAFIAATKALGADYRNASDDIVAQADSEIKALKSVLKL